MRYVLTLPVASSKRSSSVNSKKKIQNVRGYVTDTVLYVHLYIHDVGTATVSVQRLAILPDADSIL